MGKFFDEIPDLLLAWLDKQKIFWVATAPSLTNGFVNVSLKGVEGSFHVVSQNRVWYEDLTGSGMFLVSPFQINLNAYRNVLNYVRGGNNCTYSRKW